MMKTNFYPLRTIVGPSIKIDVLKVIIPGLAPIIVETRLHPDAYDAVNDTLYSNFLPVIVKDDTKYHPALGMDTMPIPNSNSRLVDQISVDSFLGPSENPADFPFPAEASVASIFGYSHEFVNQRLSPIETSGQSEAARPFRSGEGRRISFLIQLEREALVGGICFNGYPYISSSIEKTAEGMTVGNFGLPREIAVTPLPAIQVGKPSDEFLGFYRTQFIDSEYAYTRQEIVSHSGLNYLTIDPVKTNQLILSVADLPFIPRLIDLKSNSSKPAPIKGFVGFAIPYLYVFEYKEQTKRPARLPAGILGVRTQPPNVEDRPGRVFSEYEHYFPTWNDPDRVTGIIRNEGGTPMPGVTVRLQRTGQVVLTDDLGQFTLAGVQGDDVLEVSGPSFATFEIHVSGNTTFDVQLPYSDLGRNEHVYSVFTAHSAFGQRREFPYLRGDFVYPDEAEKLWRQKDPDLKLKECFVSDVLRANEKVILYVQQGEELERCVAGFKAGFLLIPPDTYSVRIAEDLANFFGVGDHNNVLNFEERTFAEDFLALISSLPPEVDFCEKIGLRIYELDPLDGVSPAAVNLDSKYSTLLADTTIDDFNDVILSQATKGIPFRRTSSSKYFALELSNKGTSNGQVVMHSLQMMRSAHVAVQPRAARTQQVKALHYRLIGPELADDFSRLGNEGFNFSIDRMVAGQPKSVLYSATSLLDLLHTGNARIQSNIRRPAVEFEMVQNYGDTTADLPGGPYGIKQFEGDNFTRRNEDNRTSKGWRRTEAGSDVEWNYAPPPDGRSLPYSPPLNYPNRPEDHPGLEDESSFLSYGTNENRVHSTMLFPDANDLDWQTIATLGNMLKVITDPLVAAEDVIDNLDSGVENLTGFIDALRDGLAVQMLIRTYKADPSSNSDLPDQLVKDFVKFWRGINTEEANLRVTGIVSSSQSPASVIQGAGNTQSTLISNLVELLQRQRELQNALGDPNPGMIGDLFENLAALIRAASRVASPAVGTLATIPILNGMSSGITTGIGININSGPNAVFPSYQFTANSGSTGSINKSANNTGYSYSQTLSVGYENTQLGASELKRIVTRRELTGKDNQRIRGAEIMWQDKVQDIITGTIPLNFILPSTATKLNFRTADDTLRVRFNSGFSSSVEVDFWFELTEETIRDDN